MEFEDIEDVLLSLGSDDEHLFIISGGAICLALLAFGVWFRFKTGSADGHKWRQVCWHCNQQVSIAFDWNPYRWMCPKCEDWNVLDQNLEPVDYTPDQLPLFKATDHAKKLSSATTAKRSSSNERAFVLCDNCQDSQTRKVQLLSHFEYPQMSDSSFAAAADLYSKELERKFSLCSVCEGTVRRALAASQRLVMTNTLDKILDRSKSLLVKSDDSVGASYRWRLFMWSVMTLLRWMTHLVSWLALLSKDYDLVSEDLIDTYLNTSQKENVDGYVFLLILMSAPAALSFPIQPPKSFIHEKKIRSSLRGRGQYFLSRLFVLAYRSAIFGGLAYSLAVINQVLEIPHSPIVLLIIDIAIVFYSRYYLNKSTSINDEILRKVGTYLSLNKSEMDPRQPPVAVASNGPRQDSNFLSSLSLNSQNIDEDVNNNRQSASVHPFEINNIRKRFVIGSNSLSEVKSFASPPSASFSPNILSSNSRNPLRQPTNVQFRNAQFSAPTHDTGLENLLDSVSLREPAATSGFNESSTAWNLYGLFNTEKK